MKSRFDGWSHQVIDAENTVEVVSQIEHHGFAIVESPWKFGVEDFTRLSTLYHLGAMYQSSFNRLEHHEGMFASGINQVGGLPGGKHYAFNGTSDVSLHTDGSYLPIGSIRTSILLCKEHALSGGETILFDSVSAFKQLQKENPMLSEVLMIDNVFKRKSTETSSGKQYERIGPIYRRDANGELVGGFTLDVTADWEYAYRVNARVIDAITYLSQRASGGSPYFLEFSLRKGQALIMRNDQISHGRRAFIDDPAKPRILLRGLFANAPRHHAEHEQAASGEVCQ
ncbi:TauD/TfdA family dioxygenase [Ralstonia solanacearum]|uniref:Clavaminate synthase n=1 Tax=Ralstonia solanacearum TaxID=305 RepID=A0AAD0SCG8_RALSL|nr:TauD/TfdA family dioxygenase [Ralstonia solanacearum]AXV84522.1 clavaminate synthase [Ralstonia solanacearum]AXW55650.1 clavaminate synthase [Ralstonia solanacearum]